MVTSKKTSGSKEPAKSSSSVFQRLPNYDMFGANPGFLIQGEDSNKTSYGCIMSCFLILIMLGVTTFYIWRFIVKGENIVAQTISMSDSGIATHSISINTGFFLSIMFRENEKLVKFNKIDKEIIEINAYLISIEGGDEEGSPPTQDRTLIELKNCDELNIDPATYKGRDDAVGVNARCVDFTGDKQVSGYQGANIWKYIEIEVMPCDKTEATCMTKDLTENDHYHSGPPNQAAFRQAFHRLKNLELIFSYSDSTLDAENFDNPITKVVSSATRVRLDMMQKKYFDFFIGDFTVLTKYGIFYPFQTEVSSFYIAEKFHDSTNRQPGYEESIVLDKDEPAELVPDAYAIMRIQAGAHVNSVEIEYETLIDAFGNIGGVSEALIFIMIFFIFFHSDVRYEQRLLNEGLLEQRKEEAKAQKKLQAKLDQQGLKHLKTVSITQTKQDGSILTYDKTFKVSTHFISNCILTPYLER